MLQYRMESPVGPLYLVASATGLRAVAWSRQPAPMTEEPHGILRRAVRELEEYFAGERRKFDVPLETDGSEFQERVWKQLRQIPYGQTLSYKGVADRLGSKAIRAVGSANGANPLCIISPCHRVIASDGSLGGFSGGLAIKRWLLELELRGTSQKPR